MGVTTTADEKRDRAKEILDSVHKQLKEATDLLDEAMDSETWGSGDYNSTYKDDVIEVTDEILILRRNLSNLKKRL